MSTDDEFENHEGCPWEIPGSWQWLAARDVFEIVGGSTPSTTDKRNYDGGDIPWITPADLSGYTSKHIERGARNITQRGLESSSARLLPAGTVLFSSRAPIGYVAITTQPAATNQGFKSFVPPNGIDSDYVYYYLKRAKELAVALASGTTFPEISGKKAGLIPFPIAPLPEQRRIVEEIETQFTRLDDAVAALQRVKANLKRYRASVLKAACEGRLVPTEAELARTEGRDYEPADVLLQRILAERRAKWEHDELAKMIAKGKPPTDDRWKAKYTEPQPPDTSDLPDLPEGWCWATLDQLLRYLRNGISAKPDADFGLRILRISAVRPMSVDLNDFRYLGTNLGTFQEYQLAEGDLLFTRYNGNPAFVGVCGVVRNLRTKTVHPDKLIRGQTASRSITSEFVEAVVNAGVARDFLARRVRTTAGQSGISGGDLKSTPIPLAPVREQSRISQEVSRSLSVIDELQSAVNYNLQRAERLRQSILKRAFEGKLVPQDPSDEPASVLLERIRAERAATSPNGKAKTAPRGRRAKQTAEARMQPLFGEEEQK